MGQFSNEIPHTVGQVNEHITLKISTNCTGIIFNNGLILSLKCYTFRPMSG